MSSDLISMMIGDLLEEYEKREIHRTSMRMLRDTSNPLEIPRHIFVDLYRLDQETFLFMANLIKPFMSNGNSRSIPKEIKILAALHFFAHGSNQKAVGTDMHVPMCQSSVSRCINEVSTAIVSAMGTEYIKFPRTSEEIEDAKRLFYTKYGFPGVVGCIDGTHIAIKGPSDENTRMQYYNRKGFYSINCQIVCNANLEITSINARFPGSCHDSAIWTTSNTSIRAHMRSCAPGTWLLGDSGYPLEPWLMTPYENPTTEAQRRYNEWHIRVRNIIERVIGILKARFRCLIHQRELLYKHIKATSIIYACVILHNICIRRNIMHSNIEDLISQTNNINQPNSSLSNSEYLSAGRQVRENIISEYFA